MAPETGLGARLKAGAATAKEKIPGLAHGLRMQQRISAVNGSVQAGGVTYFGFLSFFPILALAFFAVGYVARIWPEAQDNLETVLGEMLPGLIGDGPNQISLQAIQDNATAVGLIGLAGVTYAGLGWLSALRNALTAVFDKPQEARPNFVLGKARDLMTLVVLGIALLASVSVSGLVAGFSEDLLRWLQWPGSASRVLTLVGIVLGLAVSTGVFVALYWLLAHPRLPLRSLAGGALLAAVGFEALKWASTYLLQLTRNQAAFQAFGIALILLVWINYVSRIALYGAAWAATAQAVEAGEAVGDAETDDSRLLRERVERSRHEPVPGGGDDAGSGARSSSASARDGRARDGRASDGRAKVFLGGAGLGAVAALVAHRRLRDR
jgi:membrane protein